MLNVIKNFQDLIFTHFLSLLSFSDQCTMTRTYLFLHKFWFFSTIYYFGNWAFIAVSPRLHTAPRMAGECTHAHIFLRVPFLEISSQEQISVKGFSSESEGRELFHTYKWNVSLLMSVFVCRPSSSAWRFPAAEGRSLWLKGRWKRMILTSAMMNTCTEQQQQQCSLGWLGRYFRIYHLIYQLNNPDLFLLSRVCSGVLLVLAWFRPSPSFSVLSPPRQIVFSSQCYRCVWEIPAPTSESLSPQVWRRPFFFFYCWRRCFCELLLNF